jgi:hypothetical protein
VKRDSLTITTSGGLRKIDNPAEVWIAGIYSAILFFAVLGRYLLLPKRAMGADPVLAGVGLELGTREQIDHLVLQVKRCADALERLADKRQDEIQETLEEIVEEMRRPRPNLPEWSTGRPGSAPYHLSCGLADLVARSVTPAPPAPAARGFFC